MSLESELLKVQGLFGKVEEVVDTGVSIFQKATGAGKVDPTTVPSPTTQAQTPTQTPNPVPQQTSSMFGDKTMILAIGAVVALVVLGSKS